MMLLQLIYLFQREPCGDTYGSSHLLKSHFWGFNWNTHIMSKLETNESSCWQISEYQEPFRMKSLGIHEIRWKPKYWSRVFCKAVEKVSKRAHKIEHPIGNTLVNACNFALQRRTQTNGYYQGVLVWYEWLTVLSTLAINPPAPGVFDWELNPGPQPADEKINI